MRIFQKKPVPGFVQVLYGSVIIDGEKRLEKLYCPVRPSTADNTCPCGEWCVWYSEIEHGDGTIYVRCKGDILGILEKTT